MHNSVGSNKKDTVLDNIMVELFVVYTIYQGKASTMPCELHLVLEASSHIATCSSGIT